MELLLRESPLAWVPDLPRGMVTPAREERPPMTTPEELKDLAQGIGCDVSEEQAALLLGYLDAMLDENTRVNLTAVREREDAVRLHALDSLALGAAWEGPPPSRCLDIGTGNGFPGVAAACLYPDAEVLLIDRTRKKVDAIQRALATAGIDTSRVRTEQLDAAEAPSRGLKHTFDLITTRAVASPGKVGALARPLLARGGRFLCWISDDPTALSAQVFKMKRTGRLDYSVSDRSRHILVFG